jgi:hypothetical protein
MIDFLDWSERWLPRAIVVVGVGGNALLWTLGLLLWWPWR